MPNNVHVQGGDQLAAVLNQLPAAVGNKLLRNAARKGVKEIQTVARQRVPKRSGALKGSLRIGTRMKNGVVTATLKAGGKKAPHAHLVEFDTAAHTIHAKKGGALTLPGGALRDVVHHPGTHGTGFLRSSMDSAAPAAVDAVATDLRDKLPALAESLVG